MKIDRVQCTAFDGEWRAYVVDESGRTKACFWAADRAVAEQMAQTFIAAWKPDQPQAKGAA